MENINVNVSVEMHNASEPRLPSVEIKPLTLEGLTYFLLTIVPITLFIGLPLLYICRAHVSLGATQSETEHLMGGCFKLL